MNVLHNSLDLTSTSHKTYNAEGDHARFRDAIQFAVDKFLSLTSIANLKRIGLRYIDECPLPEDLEVFKNWYNSVFPTERFHLNAAQELTFIARTHREEGKFLRFQESYKMEDEGVKYTLDFDGYAENVPAESYLDITDGLHDFIHQEWKTVLREPVLQVMRQPKR